MAEGFCARRASGTSWGNILIAELEHATIRAGSYWNDAWDGYPLARQRLLDSVVTPASTNPSS